MSTKIIERREKRRWTSENPERTENLTITDMEKHRLGKVTSGVAYRQVQSVQESVASGEGFVDPRIKDKG